MKKRYPQKSIQRGERLKEEIKKKYSLPNIRILVNIKNMVNIMKKIDLAISSNGRTLLELAYFQIPTLCIPENDRDAAGYGFRPISADGVPYIGRSNKLKNVVIATGHALMGWSMSTGTGKIVAEIIDDKKTSINIDRFNPNRKF